MIKGMAIEETVIPNINYGSPFLLTYDQLEQLYNTTKNEHTFIEFLNSSINIEAYPVCHMIKLVFIKIINQPVLSIKTYSSYFMRNSIIDFSIFLEFFIRKIYYDN